MKVVRNNKGFTLIEVLAAMTILSIILISVMNIFPQMGMMNNHNEEKSQGINSAKQLLIEWSKNTEVKNALRMSDPLPEDWPPEFVSNEPDYYLFKTVDPKAEIKIQKQHDLNSAGNDQQYNAHQIKIQVLNNRDVVVSETYGYVMVRR